MKTKLITLQALAVFALAFMTNGSLYAANPSLPTNDQDTLIVNNPHKVTVITGDSLQSIRIEGRNDDPDFRYENTLQLVDSNYVSGLMLNGDNWEFSLPIGKKRSDEWVENEVTMHLGFGWCNALGSPENMDVSMGSSWEIFWTIGQWDYTAKNSRSTWSTGIGVDWRNYRMTSNLRFEKTPDECVVISPYAGENVRPKFSRVKVFSLQMPLLYRYKFNRNFSFSVGPVLNLNLHSSLKTRYKIDGQKYKDTDNDARVNPVTVDIMSIIETPVLDLYIKYSPCNVLKTDFAPKFQSLSLGFYI